MEINGINSNLKLMNINKQIQDKDAIETINFSDFLRNALGDVNQLQNQADESNTLLAAGKVDNISKVMIDSEKAAIALEFTVQIRNKIMDAYNEIMRMQM